MNEDRQYCDYEEEIDIKYLLYKTVKNWRKILIFSLVIGILAGLFITGKTLVSSLDSEAKLEAYQDYERDLRNYEHKGEYLKQKILTLNDDLQEQQDYLNNSLLMNIDPNNVYDASFDIIIDSGDKENNDNSELVNLYLNYINNGELYKQIKDNVPSINIEEKYLAEIIKASISYANDKIDLNNMISVDIKTGDESISKELLTFITECLNNKYEEINIDVNHKIKLFNINTNLVIDEELKQKQQSQNDLLNTTFTNIEKAKSELETYGSEGAPEYQYDAICIIKQTIKWLIIGLSIGFVISCAYYFFLYIVSSHIVGTEIFEIYNVNVLGKIVNNNNSIRKIDTIIEKIFGYIDLNATYENTCALAAMNIVSMLKGKKEKKVAIVSTVDNEAINNICNAMNGCQKYIKFEFVGDIIKHAEGIKLLEKYKYVVIVSQEDKTLKDDFINQVQKLKLWNKDLLGNVVCY